MLNRKCRTGLFTKIIDNKRQDLVASHKNSFKELRTSKLATWSWQAQCRTWTFDPFWWRLSRYSVVLSVSEHRQVNLSLKEGFAFVLEKVTMLLWLLHLLCGLHSYCRIQMKNLYNIRLWSHLNLALTWAAPTQASRAKTLRHLGHPTCYLSPCSSRVPDNLDTHHGASQAYVDI